MDAKAKAVFAQFDADLEALRENTRRLALLAANAMLANASPEPAGVALEDAPPRMDLPRAEMLARRQNVSAKEQRRRDAEGGMRQSGWLRGPVYFKAS